MSWVEFKNKMFEMGCFSVHQVYAWRRDFDRNNLTRWVQKGYLLRLRRGWYAFPEFKSKPEFADYIAGRIYRPSYISLHSALAFYGLIPEAVLQITSVTTLKTASFINDFGEYSYKSVKSELMFGYFHRQLVDGRSTPYATCEKALLDLLYLYPFYNTEAELLELRLDQAMIHENFDKRSWRSLGERFECAALEQRMKLLEKVYEL
ncbi:MAG: type IV toxin-antitoxin system AbiEi family antitoxin domain-containing protein [Verrucomicrobiota bacterium]